MELLKGLLSLALAAQSEAENVKSKVHPTKTCVEWTLFILGVRMRARHSCR